MDLDALIRSIALRDRHYMLLLGAGASISSGIPTATDCIWDWKRRLFLSQNSEASPRVLSDATLPHVQQRIQRWLDRQGKHPPPNDPSEYSHYADVCFPLSADRQEYFKGLVLGAKPHLGYQLLGILIEAGKLKWIWTTNFDDLVERGRPQDRTRPILQIGMDTVDRLDQIRRDTSDIVQVFLHGEYDMIH